MQPQFNNMTKLKFKPGTKCSNCGSENFIGEDIGEKGFFMRCKDCNAVFEGPTYEEVKREIVDLCNAMNVENIIYKLRVQGLWTD